MYRHKAQGVSKDAKQSDVSQPGRGKPLIFLTTRLVNVELLSN